MAETKLKEQSMNTGILPFSGAVVNQLSVTVLTTAVWEPLLFDNEEEDTDSYHDNVTNNSRFTVSTTSLYLVIANVTIEANGTGQRMLGIWTNGGANEKNAQERVVATTASLTALSVSVIIPLTIGDYVEARVYQNSGGDLDATTANTNFSIMRLN